MQFVGLTKEFLDTQSPNNIISDVNEIVSLKTLIFFGKFHALLTADSQVDELNDVLSYINVNRIDAMQVPHHRSRFGLNVDILQNLNPKLAVILVGKNKFGHPTPFTLNLLKDLNI